MCWRALFAGGGLGGGVHMLRPQVMLTRQHCPPCPLGLKQEI